MLFALFVLLLATVQEPTSEFSAPPADAPDFLSWGVDKESEHILTLADAGQILGREFLRAGLCRSDELSCPVRLRADVYSKHQCIAQSGQEFDCRRRLAWKSKKRIGIVVRYTMTRGTIRTEGFAMEIGSQGNRFFVRTNEPKPSWHEVSPKSEEQEWSSQEVLYVQLLVKLLAPGRNP